MSTYRRDGARQMVEEVAGPWSPQPREDIVLHVGSWLLESCQAAKPPPIKEVKASCGTPRPGLELCLVHAAVFSLCRWRRTFLRMLSFLLAFLHSVGSLDP